MVDEKSCPSPDLVEVGVSPAFFIFKSSENLFLGVFFFTGLIFFTSSSAKLSLDFLFDDVEIEARDHNQRDRTETPEPDVKSDPSTGG